MFVPNKLKQVTGEARGAGKRGAGGKGRQKEGDRGEGQQMEEARRRAGNQWGEPAYWRGGSTVSWNGWGGVEKRR